MNRFSFLTFATFYFIIMASIGYEVGGKLIFISHEMQKVPLSVIVTALERVQK